jgi:phosphoesterase RecJ-like protein
MDAKSYDKNVAELIDRLSCCRRVLITTHVRPDGDAIGTTAALAMGLRKKNIDAEVLLLSHLPTKYSFIFRENQIKHFDVEKGWPETFSIDQYDALLVADTGTWSQLPGLRERIANFKKPKLVLDHHLTQEDWADTKLVITEAAAAGEIAAELLDRWNIDLDSGIATALFVAIVSDTGWFQFSNTRPVTYRLAAKLVEAGVDTDRIYQLLYQNERAERIALQSRALQSMQLLADGRLAVMTIMKQDFADTRAHVPDTENLINIPLQIKTIEVSILLTDPPEGGPIRISLRSKGQLDCAKFAEQFGGGGHARAAGLKVEGAVDEIRQRILSALATQL